MNTQEARGYKGDSTMQLCLTCAAKVRLAFPRKELKQVGGIGMTDKEIVKLFREGLNIERLTEQEWVEQKEARKKRQAKYRQQQALAAEKRKRDPDYRLLKKDRVIVGPRRTRFMAQTTVESAIYKYVMSQSKAG